MKLWSRRLLIARRCCAALLLCCTATYGAACDPTRQSCAPTEGGAGGAQSCTPSPGGSTCDGSGPASQGNASGTNQGAGNPINLISGNKYQQEVDMPALPGILGLEIVRHYNSQYSLPNVPNGILGRGWKLSYESELYDTPVGVQIVQADGTRLIFQRSKGDASHCTSTNPANGSVTIVDKPGGKEYVWRWPNGRELQFNAQRKLVQIAAATGEFVTLGYDPQGWLIYVRDPQGRELRLRYATASQDGTQRFRGVQSIASPVGRYTYAYGSPLPAGSQAPPRLLLSNLTRVGIPAAQAPTSGPGDITRAYHYEDPKFPTLLTGISVQGSGSDGVQMSQRISTYGYDNQGKAILSQKAQGIEKITLDTNTPRQTILTNSLGQKTTYLHANIAGQWRLLQSRGAGCASCGPANVRYAYDNVGRLTEQTTLDAAGQPLAGTRTAVDAQGRPVRVERVRYARGKADAVELLLRYEYQGDAPSPTLIARPSVVAGKEHRTHIAYNAHGQPREITETGYEPLNQSRIQRSTRYTYQTINGRSVLQSIDGPLPNGPQGTPQDSDITTLQWDRTGSFITRRTDPGNIFVDLAHDDAGRIVQTTMDDGFRQVRTETRYAQMGAIAREPEQITRSAWLLQDKRPLERSLQNLLALKVRHDALGRRTQHSGTNNQSSTMRYDGAGRPSDLTDAQGNRMHWAYDDRGQLLAEIIQDAQGTISNGHLWLRSDDGRLRAVLQPGGIERIHAYLDEGMRVLPRATFETARLPSEVPFGILRDDFGRVVQERLPQDGIVRTDYTSEAGREVQTQVRVGTDGTSSIHESLAFDVAGRLITRHRNHCIDRLSYQGRMLTRMEGCGDAQEFERDAFGRIVEHTQTTADLHFTQRYWYDDVGQLSARKLADGQVVQYGYDRAGRTQSVRWQRDWLNWVAQLAGQAQAQTLTIWLPDSAKFRVIASDIQHAPFARGLGELQALWHGNGEQQTWKTDATAAPRIVQATARKLQSAPVPVDAWGRQTHHRPSQGRHEGEEQTLIWDEAHQLVAVKSRSGETLAQYAYDALGNRIAKDVKGQMTRFVYDTSRKLVAEADAGGKITRQYLYADHRVHGILQDGKLYAVHTDWRGLPDRITDEAQRPVWSAKFDDWGVEQPGADAPAAVATAPAFAMPLRLAGQYADNETGLHYNVHRYFDPVARRYMTPDPLGAADGRNRYAYLRGNPWAGIDPLGLFAIPAGYFAVGYMAGMQHDVTLQSSSMGDGGHGDILRIAFYLYQQQSGQRFSQTIIDQIILNNYHADAVGWNGGQRHEPNHFDNPNTGPYQLRDPKTGKQVGDERYKLNWFAPDVAELNAWREGYTTTEGADISMILNAFGRNTHSIADFYAHSNWVDAPYRGGCYAIEWASEGKAVKLGAWVPTGLNQYTLWDEQERPGLFSGTVCASCGDIGANKDLKHTHAYWAKDDASHLGGADSLDFAKLWGLPVQFQDRYEVKPDAKGGYAVVKVAMNNKHDLAFHLAVMHTLQEIDRLWAGLQLANAKDGSKYIAPGIKIVDVFTLSAADLKAKGIQYQAFFDKSFVPPGLKKS